MNIKKDIVFREAKKEDYPSIIEFLKENYIKRLDCEHENTEKLLSKLLFYDDMSKIDYFRVATYRKQVVGVIMSGLKKKLSPVYKIKKVYFFCRLKMTKDGRWNLDILNQIAEIRNKLEKQKKESDKTILFLYVSKKYRRHGIGTELLHQMEKMNNTRVYVYMNQEEKSDFMEKQGFTKIAYAWKMMELHRQRFRETVSLYCKEKSEFENGDNESWEIV